MNTPDASDNASVPASPYQVLFVCTGNYYRSRFAEEWFSLLAQQRRLKWRTDSAGLRVDFEQKINPGPIHKVTLDSLAERGIQVPNPRMPRDLTHDDLEQSARIILLDEPEHRPMMQARFPDWEDHPRVTYWKIVDVPPSETFHPLNAIDPLVKQLIDELEASSN